MKSTWRLRTVGAAVGSRNHLVAGKSDCLQISVDYRKSPVFRSHVLKCKCLNGGEVRWGQTSHGFNDMRPGPVFTAAGYDDTTNVPGLVSITAETKIN